jgi:L-asparaginase
MRRSDAVFNLGFAMAAAGLLSPGVYVAMNGEVFEAGRVRKNTEAGRFQRD